MEAIMLILAMDSSSAACSAALARGATLLANRNEEMARGHAAALPPMIADILMSQGITARDLDAVAVSTGPGSFTGLRVAMAAAKGLALAIDRPLVGISCFDAVARQAITSGGVEKFDLMLVALASKREEVFVQARDHLGGEVIPGQALTPNAFDEQFGDLIAWYARVHVVGEAARRLAETPRRPDAEYTGDIAIGPTRGPDAVEIALLAIEALSARGGHATGLEKGLAPIYMRPPAATRSRP
jgi:tRNA threonylcarbamoyladenosine biosynthesis protein TsaB